MPNNVSQIGLPAKFCVSTVTAFVSHGDVTPFTVVRAVTTFKSATKMVWDTNVVN